MKILILCNVMLPEIANELKVKPINTGGWLTGAINGLMKYTNDIQLYICFPTTLYNKNIMGRTMKFEYYGFNNSKNWDLEKYFLELINEINPDIIHIFGTEYGHTLSMMKACNSLNKSAVISIQGLVSIYAQHYDCGLSIINKYAYSLRDIIRNENIYKSAKKFKKRGINEIKSIKMCKNVIGRTDWDEACTKQINNNVKYYKCNEILRDSFYKNRWHYENCEKQSIFISQIYNPIKGFHQMIKAISIIKKEYPNIKIYTTGNDIIHCSFFNKLKLSHYSLYLRRLIKKNKLEENIVFLGQLNEREMCNQYLKSNLFILPSSIENSPNSLGEAMLLGVPTICSDVGGIKNMFCHEIDGFIYPFDEPYMLAYYIKKIFDSKEIMKHFSQNARKHALKTHDEKINTKNLLNIYDDIIRKGEM